MQSGLSERAIVFLLGAVQFVNILDFVMVMPLGPDFARTLDMTNDQVGYVAAAYTFAAALSGLVGSAFLDAFDRRKALAVAMLGLVIATAAGGFAGSLTALIVARAAAGAFGGPATSLTYSIVADVIPAERRGRAIGAMMGAFSIASVLGVPAGLELARIGTWRLPFWALGGLGLVVAGAAIAVLPPMTKHLEGDAPPAGGAAAAFRDLVRRPVVQLAWVTTAVVFMSSFIVIPNISAYIQENLGYPREDLGWLYLYGGVFSFVTMRLVGALVDRFGSARVAGIGAAMLLVVLGVGFLREPEGVPVLALFVGFMVAMGFRNVSFNTLTTKVPAARERARFASVQSAVQHFAAAIAATVAASLLFERPDHSLEGMPLVAAIAMVLTAIVPLLLWAIERQLPAEAPRASPPAIPA